MWVMNKYYIIHFFDKPGYHLLSISSMRQSELDKHFRKLLTVDRASDIKEISELEYNNYLKHGNKLG